MPDGNASYLIQCPMSYGMSGTVLGTEIACAMSCTVLARSPVPSPLYSYVFSLSHPPASTAMCFPTPMSSTGYAMSGTGYAMSGTDVACVGWLGPLSVPRSLLRAP
eukprot:3157031-Rhodomonas_salina.1